MKISNQFLFTSLTDNMTDLQSRMGENQIHISSNKKYILRSDAPIDSSNAAQAKRTQQQNIQWDRNFDAAMHWTKVTEGMLTGTVDSLQRVKELTVQSKDSTITAEDRIIIGKELDSILEQIVMVANTPQGDAYLFAGTDSTNIPFTITRGANDEITAVATTGDPSNQRAIQGAETVTIKYGRTAAGSEGVFDNTSTGVNVFNTIITLRDDLLAGNMPPDSSLSDIESTLNNVVSQLVSTGVDHSRFEKLQHHYDTVNVALADALGELEAADLPMEITELSQLQASLQASMQMAARLGSLSLINYI